MKNIPYLFLVTISLLILSCGEDPKSDPPTTTAKESKIAKKTDQQKLSKKYNFNFSDTQSRSLPLHIQNHIYNFSNIAEPIVLVNFFATWCPPCRGELPHLNNLQKSYKKQLSILGLLIDDDISPQELDLFITSQKINYTIASNQGENQRFAKFIAPKLRLKADFDIPLMILFVQGRYYTHYMGTVPEEMIESDIKQALNKIKGQK
jgi:thiol-disulfide isomerase/thioredoxin